MTMTAYAETGRYFDAGAVGYDDCMLGTMELEPFYEAVAAQFAGLADGFDLLDLGVGTGLQLERLLARYPAMAVTGVDLSAGMLERLKDKYPAARLDLRCGNCVTTDFGRAAYDAVLSTYALHHLERAEKAEVYRRACAALRPGGFLVEGDLVAATRADAEEGLAGRRRMLELGAVPAGGHFDIPLALEDQLALLRGAGFGRVEVIQRWTHTALIRAER